MLWIKAVHVMSIISWMAGLLYLYRLFVYHAMETETVVQQRLQIMERRLINGIAHPAAVLSVATGITMLWMVPGYLNQPWMHVKLTCVLGLLVSHGMGMRYRKKLITQPNAVPHRTFRILNEVPTLLMIAIVIMIIVRPWSR
jgi:protoporphyrinogen IX oxidase